MTMRIDLTCPVEAWKSTLPTQENPTCEVTLFNLSSLQVVSVEVTILLSSSDGEETAKVIHRSRGLNGAPGKTFAMQVPVEGHISPERYEITVEKVWFDNSSVWRREKENTITYKPNNLRRSAQLTTLRAIAGEMASGYPEQQEGLWLCVCGRPNLDDAQICARCHREKAEVFRRFSREAIDAVVAAREDELAEHGRDTLRQTSRRFADEKDFVRRKGQLGWIVKLAAALVLIAVLGFAGYTYGVPYVKYEMAMKAYEEGRYTEAEEQFAALGDYREAAAMVSHCRMEQAELLAGTPEDPATEEELLQARALYAGLNDEVNVARCDWLLAEIMFSEGRYDEAEAIYRSFTSFTLTAGYDGQISIDLVEARLTEIDYIRACDMLARGDWEEARKAFEALGEYKDSAALRLDTWYNPAMAAMEAGDTETALALFAQIPGHRDADRMIKKIHYDRGVQLRAEGKINEAAEAFHLARGYEDAEDQANECFYGPASVAYEIMEYEQAAELFGKIRGYRDADEKWRSSLIEAAKIAMKQINYPKALSFLEQLPEDDAEAAELIRDCTYYPAVNAYVRGDYEEAIALFASIPGHRDSDVQIVLCRYDWAGALYEAGDYDKAAELYTALGDYEDCPERLIAVRYAQACAALEAGDTLSVEKAIELFTALGDYEDSPAKLQDALFAKAEILLEKGEHEAARGIFLQLGDYPGAAELLTACDYAAAQALADAGRTEEAIAAFEALGDYEDSAEKVKLLRYDAALALSVTDPEAAIEALEAMGDYADAANQARELRYQQAERLLETDRAAAIAAFRALGDYADAQERADELCYEDAEALLETDRAAAIAAFEALGDYSDAHDRACELRYEDASALAEAGDWEAAAAMFDLIAGYRDATERADQLRYEAGVAYAENGEWDKAAAAFAAMSSAENADEQVNALRYEAAEKLLAAGNVDGAIAAFEAIAGYADAGDRANELRYRQAEELALTDWAAGAAAFEALGDYADSAARANALRYNAAAQTAAAGDWQTAAAMFEALGDYSDSADKALQVRYEAAAAMVARQEWEEAIALYTLLGDYADSRERISMTRYAQAEAAEKAGDYLAAAKLYAGISGYRNASAKVDEMYDLYYAGPAEAMRKASEAKNYQEVIQIMSWLDMTDAPARYKNLISLYQEALYQEGNRLFSEGKPYEAYVYYKQLPANYRAMAEKLQRPCYLILGTWEDRQGNRYIFREEGVCNLNGEVLYFNVENSAMYTGESADSLTATHRLNGVNRYNAYLYDKRGDREVTIYLTRVKE